MVLKFVFPNHQDVLSARKLNCFAVPSSVFHDFSIYFPPIHLEALLESEGQFEKVKKVLLKPYDGAMKIFLEYRFPLVSHVCDYCGYSYMSMSIP